ncbi:MAG: heparan-alpha-glucosaminide N-acetyltransferase [Candidatus Aenigmatarchaeota archaeon]
MQRKLLTDRVWEIDFLRGTAVILMLFSNFATDVAYFRIYPVDVYSGFWLYLARIIVSMFILVSGMSLTLSYYRMKNKKPAEIRKKYFFRGARIFGLGILITIVTSIFIRDFVAFGVLHLIGFSVFFGQFLAGRKRECLILGISFLLTGIFLQGIRFGFPWLLWLGFIPEGYSSVDYVPVFPWFGFFLIGMFLGNVFYPDGNRRFNVRDFSGKIFIKPVSFLGRNSLKIYLIHQPLLILFLRLSFPYNFPF